MFLAPRERAEQNGAFLGRSRERRDLERRQQGELKTDPFEIANRGWALVHGLASLELMGCLGPPDAAEATWRGALEIMEAGLRQVG